MENAYLKKPYDTLQVYNSALNMCKFYFKCDNWHKFPMKRAKSRINIENLILLQF